MDGITKAQAILQQRRSEALQMWGFLGKKKLKVDKKQFDLAPSMRRTFKICQLNVINIVNWKQNPSKNCGWTQAWWELKNEEPPSKLHESPLCCNWKSGEQGCEEKIINPTCNSQSFI